MALTMASVPMFYRVSRGLTLFGWGRDYDDAVFLDIVHADVAWDTPVEFRNIIHESASKADENDVVIHAKMKKLGFRSKLWCGKARELSGTIHLKPHLGAKGARWMQRTTLREGVDPDTKTGACTVQVEMVWGGRPRHWMSTGSARS